jgi:hypothetical protein
MDTIFSFLARNQGWAQITMFDIYRFRCAELVVEMPLVLETLSFLLFIHFVNLKSINERH